MNTVICWFRRDLRVHDHTALFYAARDAENVIPLFIIDPTLMAAPHAGGPRVNFLLDSLQELSASLRKLGGQLIVRQGHPSDVILNLLRESNADGLYVNRDYIAPGLERDKQVKSDVESAGFMYRDFHDLVVHEPDDLLTKTQAPYTIFTPYYKSWRAKEAAMPLEAPTHVATPELQSAIIPTPSDLGWSTTTNVAKGGEAEAHRLLNEFTVGPNSAIHGYAVRRDLPAIRGTSHLSPHLRFGTISPRTLLHSARLARLNGDDADHMGPGRWESELAWRDFYFAWMFHFPRVEKQAFIKKYDNLPYDNDQHKFDAWCTGQTGYPIVDAGMRQLNAGGWMHNRLRMITANFLCKDLSIDWRWGENYFWNKLTDGDKPANMGGWQWSASVGTDAQPYFRMFNPVTQSEKFDAEGEYIRRYVPELESLPNKFIHSPWLLPPMFALSSGYVPGKTYPDPIVDHAAQRLRTITMFEKINGQQVVTDL